MGTKRYINKRCFDETWFFLTPDTLQYSYLIMREQVIAWMYFSRKFCIHQDETGASVMLTMPPCMEMGRINNIVVGVSLDRDFPIPMLDWGMLSE